MIRTYDYQDGIIKLPIYDASLITKGQGLIWGQDGSTTGSYTALVDCADTAADIFAVAAEGLTTLVASNLGTPLLYQCRVQLVDNKPIWKIYYDLTASTDLDVASATSTVLTVAACDDNLDGSWVYINSGTGAGQLRYVSAADATTLTVNTAFTTTPDATSDFILIRPQGLPEGGVALNSTFDQILPVLDETTSQKILVLKNFIEGPTGVQELNITDNPGLEMDGLNARGVRFYSHVMFIDTLAAATGL
jgi:hypothetical protein